MAHDRRREGDEPIWWYTCHNLLPNGDCGIHATRPALCRDYPYGRPCQYTDCQWEAGRYCNLVALTKEQSKEDAA